MNLQKQYNRDEYLEFLRTFVPDFAKDIRNVSTDRLQVTKEAHFLGESDELDLSVFELTHSSSTDARISLSMDGFKLMKASATYRALIIYRQENSDDWRFSLMTATPDVNEKGKVIQKLSNPRRFSFFLGPNAKVNTPNRFLIKDGPIKDFNDLQSRFSLEVVNKEFYKQISEQFIKLVGGTLGAGKKQKTYEPLLKLPSQAPESQLNMEFGVRLIGRIIFGWFLREKKSVNGLSLMPKELLSVEAISQYPYYYHTILEPIFFEVLNKEQKSRREDYSDKPFSLIPYLNGGLFSPHQDDFYKRPNGEQSLYHNTLIVPDEWLKELFEILETYNFTIDENTSFDEELSIDPEMLGRIFENLLAEINPETGESARKSTGSYYTPRVIVDYMVDESLLLYLQEHTKIAEEKLRAIISYDLSDDAEHLLQEDEKKQVVENLSKLKLLDPACGSGAFPIGALQKIVFILQQIDPEGKRWLHKQLEQAHPEFRRDIEKKFSNRELDFLRKLGIIRECIFGVDIQPIATEIARLRCFLTLIVDERIDDDAENRGIKPLPNLDFKFVTANSLIDLPRLEETIQVQAFDNRERINELKAIRDQYFNAYGIEREQLKTEFVTAQKRLVDQLVEEHGYMGVAKAELTQRLTNWEPFSHKSSSWFDPEWMFGIADGFDIVIGNPPYKFLSGKGSPVKLLEKEGKNIEAERLKQELDKIAQEYKNSSIGCRDYYKWFTELGIRIARPSGVIAYITPNTYLSLSNYRDFRVLIFEKSECIRLIDLGFGVFECPIVPSAIFVIKKHQIQKSDINYADLKPFNNSDLNSQGVETLWKKNHFKVKYSDGKLLLFKHLIAEKIYTKIDSTIKDVLLISEGEHSLNNDFSEEHVDGLKIIYDIDIHRYKNAEVKFLPESYCQKYSKQLHSGERFFIRKTGDSILAVPFLDHSLAIAHQNLYVAKPKTSETSLLLIALLSSKLLNFLYQNGIYGQKGRTLAQFRIYGLYELPLPSVPKETQEVMQKLVKQILSITDQGEYWKDPNKQAKVNEYEKQIDQLVYILYELTPEEIEIVEQSTKLTPAYL